MRAIYVCILLCCTLFGFGQVPELEWSFTLGGSYGDWAKSIVTGVDNAVIIAGSFSETVDFYPGPGVLEFTTPLPNATRQYIQKLEPDGSLIWAKYINMYAANSSAVSITLDYDQNILFTGQFDALGWDIDPGPAEVIVEASSDAVIIKLTPDGDIVWAKVLGDGILLDQVANDIAIDPFGNIITTGRFYGVADFDPGPDTLLLDNDNGTIFIHKMDTNGNLSWVRQVGGREAYNEGKVVGTDGAGNIYVGGCFADTGDFDPGPGELIFTAHDTTLTDIFLLKLDPEGNLLWGRHFKGSERDRINDIKVLENGTALICGQFKNSIDLDSGPDTALVVSQGSSDAFVAEINSEGASDCVIDPFSLFFRSSFVDK